MLLQPALKGLLFGSEQEQLRLQRKKRRIEQERCANYGKIPVLFLVQLKEKIISLLLSSISIQMMTLPILCYFYYEVPVYGILLNLFILPLVSALVAFSLAGGLFGLIFPAVGELFVLPARYILSLYDALCRLFLKLPGAIWLPGCPGKIAIFLYYLLLLSATVCLTHCIRYRQIIPNGLKCSFLAGCAAALTVLLYRIPLQGLEVTMLDVGQGDGILIRYESGLDILIDGGSTDVNEVGKYRLMPALKYYGICTLEYMIVTHEDEDHISGQLELLEQAEANGIKIGCLLLPELSKDCIGDNYHKIWDTAVSGGVPIRYIHAGDRIRDGSLDMLCLHPQKGFSGESPNACSTTISLRHGNISMLFTGDLENDGEKAALQELKSGRYPLPERYTFLKAAHHGSKNSMQEEFLSAVRPAICGISCGQNNRYGHPHRELLERLETVQAKTYITSETGAILLKSDGEKLQAVPFCSDT